MATLEAIFVILTIAGIWSAIIQIGGATTAQLKARAEARECAWLIAESACRSIPTHCESSDGGGGAFDKTKSLADTGEDATFGSQVAEAVRDVLMNQIRGLFAERVTATGHSTPDTHGNQGGPSTPAHASYSLPCNTKPISVSDIAADIFDRILSK
jgi:hypothetical protein